MGEGDMDFLEHDLIKHELMVDVAFRPTTVLAKDEGGVTLCGEWWNVVSTPRPIGVYEVIRISREQLKHWVFF